MFKVGDFVTGHSAGYWQIIDIKPKVAGEDYTSEKVQWKKGDVLGKWVIMKKAFTPKMKPRIDFEYEDSYWTKHVSEEVLSEINQYFLENPKYKDKFDNASVKFRPTVTNCWISLPEERVDEFSEILSGLSTNFTWEELWEKAADFKKYVSKPPSTHLLNLLGYPWEMDENANWIYYSYELMKL